jgi:2-keto-4-pentenoate hydratase
MADTRAVDLARELYEAERTRTRARRVGSVLPQLTTELAYAIQREVDRLRVEHGGEVIGRKIGLASLELQRRGGVDEPFWAHVFRDRYAETGAELEHASYLRPRVEPEIAVVLGQDLGGPGVSKHDARAAILTVRPAFEVVDVRTDVEGLDVNESIADSGWNAGCVLGEPVAAVGLDLDTVAVEVRSEREGVIASGDAAMLMDGPAGCLAWLANAAAAAGKPLRAGEIILTGTLAGAPTLASGDTLTAVFTGLGDAPATVTVSAR